MGRCAEIEQRRGDLSRIGNDKRFDAEEMG